MFNISSTQIETLASHRRDDFIKKILSILNSSFNEKFELNDNVVRTINVLIDKSMLYNIRSEHGIGIYIISAYVMGADFDTEFESIKAILNDKQTDEHRRVQALRNIINLTFTNLQ